MALLTPVIATSQPETAKGTSDLYEELEKAQSDHKRLESIYFELTERVKRIERSSPKQELQTPKRDRLGGALWLNYALKDFAPVNKDKGGDFNFDLFRVEMEGSRGAVIYSGQYRFYSYMHAIHHGWVGYQFNSQLQARVGVLQVPFGILPYASHSYWFGLPYYIGLEDDYDSGAELVYQEGSWNIQAAFFKNAEWGDPTKLERFSFDVVKDPSANQFNEEVNQVNLRTAHVWGKDRGATTELGLSLQGGFLYNSATAENGTRWAGAVHLSHFQGPWDAQIQAGRFEYHPQNPSGVSDDYIEMGAFASSRSVVAQGNFFVLNLAKEVASNWGPFKAVTCYNDYSQIFKEDPARSRHSELNTTGCRFGTQRTFTYVDWIAGRNTTFLGDSRSQSGLGATRSHGIKNRFNVNFEYYF